MTMTFATTRKWTLAELEADANEARKIFRDRRLAETLDAYKDHFAEAEKLFAELLPRLCDIVQKRISPDELAQLLKGKNCFQAFRYLGGPPISEDDVATLSGARKSSSLWTKPADVELVRDLIAKAIDPVRFPWVADDRTPTETELHAALVASGILIAQQRIGTNRRSQAKEEQESAVMTLLEAEGFTRVARRPITLLSHAPAPGEFCPESELGGTRGDIIVTLRDGRVMPIECKASNSEVNSYKRLNHEAAGKAAKWLTKFGHDQVVPAAVLSGVLKVSNLASAQSGGLALYWQNRLSDLSEFLRRSQ